MGKSKAKIIIALIVLGAIVFSGYKFFYHSVDLSTPEGTAKSFALALLRQDYETAGVIYPLEDSTPSAGASYLFGPFAGMVTAPCSLDDLMYAVDGLEKSNVSLAKYESTYYIYPDELQDYDSKKLGFYSEDDKVSVIKLSFDRIGSDYYIQKAQLVAMDSNYFYGESSEY